MRRKCLLFVFATFVLFNACSEEESINLSSEKEIVNFHIEGLTTEIDEESKNIMIYAEGSQQNLFLEPNINVSEKAIISPSSGKFQDFSRPVFYTVTAEDGSQQIYTTQLISTTGLKSFALKIGWDKYFGSIDNTSKTITVDAAFDIVKIGMLYENELIAEVETLENYTASPESGYQINLINPGEITIIGNNESSTYQIITRNSENRLYDIGFPISQPKVDYILGSGSSFTYQDPNDTLIIIKTLETDDITNVTPRFIRFSERATITPSPTTPRNFTNDIVYAVTSETGKSKDYTVRVIKEKILLLIDRSPYDSINIFGNSFSFSYLAISKIASARLVNASSGEEIVCKASESVISDTGEYIISIQGERDFPSGEYDLRVTLENGDEVDAKVKYLVNP